MNVYRTDVAILLPKITDYNRTVMRYSGLAQALNDELLSSIFASQHVSYDPEKAAFRDIFYLTDPINRPIARLDMAPVVRDLTMPKSDDRPLYGDDVPVRLVPHFKTNRFLTDKSNMLKHTPEIHPISIVVSADDVTEAATAIPGKRVILKPVTGQESQGVRLLSKKRLATTKVEPGKYLLSEFINTSRGIPELGIVGVHNVRAISIGNQLIGAIARVGGNRKLTLRDDVYGCFIDSEDLPASMHAIVSAVHLVLAGQSGNGDNVIAIDMMRGIDGNGERVDKLCEVNRRPRRISPHTILDKSKNLDNAAILHIAGLWDRAEAAMLARLVNASRELTI